VRLAFEGPGRRAWLALGAVVLLLHGALLWLERWPTERRLWGDEIMYRDLAQRFATGRAVELDPLWPPLYVWFLGGLERMLGPSRLVPQALQLACLALTAALLASLARQFTGSPWAAFLAVLLFGLDPQIQSFAYYLWPEALHLALFIGLLWLLVRRCDQPLAMLGAGVLLGLALLTKSLLMPFVPLLVLPLWRTRARRAALLATGCLLVPAALVVLPTVLANGQRHGAYVVADSSRFNLWVGLNDRSRRSLRSEIVGDEYARYRASAPTLAERNELLSTQLAELERQRGLAGLLRAQLGKQYFRLFDKDSFFTDQLPGGAIARAGYGYAAPGGGWVTGLRAWSYTLHAFVLVAAAFGCVALAPRGRAYAWFGPLFVAGNLLLFLGLHVKSRYRVQFWPFVDLLAVSVLARAGTWQLAPARLALGALLALLLLGLAFGAPLLD